MSMPEPVDFGRGVFETIVDADLQRIKATLEKILNSCFICGQRIAIVETHVQQSSEFNNRMKEGEEKIRLLELDMVRITAKGSLLGALGGIIGGFLAGLGIKFWGNQ
jgi:hypothetical protein